MSNKLAKNTTVGGDTYKAGTVPPPEVAKLITHPSAFGHGCGTCVDEPTGDQSAQETGDWNKSMNVGDLQAVVDQRNADRDPDDHIVVDGTGSNGKVTKKDLVAALEADDESADDDDDDDE